MQQIERLLSETPIQHSNLLLANSFRLLPEGAEKIQVQLYKEGLRLKYFNGTVKWLYFNFEVKFSLLRKKNDKADKETLTDPQGLKFQNSPNQQELCIYSCEKSLLIQWRDELCQLINQRGFHELYKPFRKIGKGNSATVYLAERYQDKKKVAIKAFAKQSMSSQPKGKESLINQIRIMRRFNHQSLMKLYEVFETDNSFYLVIEHLDGGQLFQKVNSRRFNLKQIQQILRKLTEGLMEMHRQNIIHRDLKPENLIFRTQNDYTSIVIADYGLATRADQEQYIFVRCGTPGYVAPEIISFKGKTGQQTISDIFSLGIIAHILATGRSPFSGKQYQEVLNQNRAANFNFNLEIYKLVDPSLLDLVQKMMKVDPKQRIKTEDLLNHQFFTVDITSQLVPNQQITADLPHERNNKKGMQKILDSNGSFTIPRPQILQGNEDEYVSVNNMGSSNSVSCSPQSIKISSFVAVKRERETGSPYDTQFKVGNRRTLVKGRGRPQLNFKLPAKQEQQKQKQKQKQDQKNCQKQPSGGSDTQCY